MSFADKAKNAAQDLTGRAREAVGAAKDDDAMKAEGEKDQASADLKQRGEHLKDAFGG